MTDLASPSFAARSRYHPAAGLVLALIAVATWFLAGIVDDALYSVSAALGAVAAAAGWKTRKGQTGSKRTIALVATIVGGLLAAEVILFTIGWVVEVSFTKDFATIALFPWLTGNTFGRKESVEV